MQERAREAGPLLSLEESLLPQQEQRLIKEIGYKRPTSRYLSMGWGSDSWREARLREGTGSSGWGDSTALPLAGIGAQAIKFIMDRPATEGQHAERYEIGQRDQHQEGPGAAVTGLGKDLPEDQHTENSNSQPNYTGKEQCRCKSCSNRIRRHFVLLSRGRCRLKRKPA